MGAAAWPPAASRQAAAAAAAEGDFVRAKQLLLQAAAQAEGANLDDEAATVGAAARELEAVAVAAVALLPAGPGRERLIRRVLVRAPSSLRLWRLLHQERAASATPSRSGARAAGRCASAAARLAELVAAQRPSLRGAAMDEEAAAELLGAASEAAPRGRHQAAVALAEASAGAGPVDTTCPQAWLAEGSAWEAGSRACVAACRRGVHSQPGNADAWLRLSLAEAATKGGAGRAARAHRAAVALDPDHSGIERVSAVVSSLSG